MQLAGKAKRKGRENSQLVLLKRKAKEERGADGGGGGNLQHSNVKFICGGEATKLGNFYGTGRNEVATKYRQ